MTQWHGDSHKRKKTGGRRTSYRGKRAYERGSPPSETRVGERRLKIKKTTGKSIKFTLLTCHEANILNNRSRKTQKTEIKDVIENPANRDYAKRGIITKGAIITTSIGKAKITSRPGQDGVINALLIEE